MVVLSDGTFVFFEKTSYLLVNKREHQSQSNFIVDLAMRSRKCQSNRSFQLLDPTRFSFLTTP